MNDREQPYALLLRVSVVALMALVRSAVLADVGERVGIISLHSMVRTHVKQGHVNLDCGFDL